MEVLGILKEKGETQKVSDRFKKRTFVLTTEANTPYPQHVEFMLTQDKCELLDKYFVGTELKVNFNLRGREWNGPQGTKYFNTLEAWRIEKVGEPSAQPQKSQSKNVFVDPNLGDEDFSDDLPF